MKEVLVLSDQEAEKKSSRKYDQSSSFASSHRILTDFTLYYLTGQSRYDNLQFPLLSGRTL